jgi:hypothetical protein
MLNANDPARQGEAVDCLLAGDNHGHSIVAATVQFDRVATFSQLLIGRLGLQPQRARLVAQLVLGDGGVE